MADHADRVDLDFSQVAMASLNAARRISLLFSFVLAMIGAIITFYAIALFVEFKLHLLDFASKSFSSLAISVVLVGIFSLLSALLGFIGSTAEKPALIGLNSLLILGLVIVQGYALVMGFDIISLLKANQIKASDLSKAVQPDNSDFTVKGPLNELQQHFECCGAHGGAEAYNFWMNFEPFHQKKSLPESCCILPMPNCAVNVIDMPCSELARTVSTHF